VKPHGAVPNTLYPYSVRQPPPPPPPLLASLVRRGPKKGGGESQPVSTPDAGWAPVTYRKLPMLCGRWCARCVYASTIRTSNGGREGGLELRPPYGRASLRRGGGSAKGTLTIS